MGFPRFLVGQRVCGRTIDNHMVEGVIHKMNNGSKVVMDDNQNLFEFNSLKTVSFIGKRLDEEVEEKIKNFSDTKMDWEQAVKDNSDTDKLADQFSNFCAGALGDGKNNEEVKEIAKNEAEMKIMDAKVKNGVSSKDAEIAKYIDMKNENIENQIRKGKLLNEADNVNSSLDYGQDNVYPVRTDTRRTGGTQYEDGYEPTIDADLDHSLMTGADNWTGVSAEAVDPLDAEVLADLGITEKAPMSPDPMIVEKANPTNDDMDMGYDDMDKSLEDSISEIDDLLRDDAEPTSNKLSNLQSEVVEKTNIPSDKAEQIISDIKDEVEATVSHAVKDIVNAIGNENDNKVTDDDDYVLADAVDLDVSYLKKPSKYQIDDRFAPKDIYDGTSYENDEIDDVVEEAIDEYADNAGDAYDENDLFESLCKKFNIQDGNKLLLESQGIVPDAILLLTEALRMHHRR